LISVRLGGTIGDANAVNNRGQVVGFSDLTGDLTNHAFIWQRGVMTDLGTLTVGGDPCSAGFDINSKGQVIGRSTDCHGTTLHVFLWENGSLIDLSSQVLPGSGFVSIDVISVINDSGEIIGNGVLANGDVHAVILEPQSGATAPGHAQVTATEKHAASATWPWSKSNTARFQSTPSTPLERMDNQMRYQYQFPRLRSSRANQVAE